MNTSNNASKIVPYDIHALHAAAKPETRGRKSVITPLIESVVVFLVKEGHPGRVIKEVTGLSLPTISKAYYQGLEKQKGGNTPKSLVAV